MSFLSLSEKNSCFFENLFTNERKNEANDRERKTFEGGFAIYLELELPRNADELMK